MLFRGVSFLNWDKFTNICPYLFIPHLCPAFLKYALVMLVDGKFEVHVYSDISEKSNIFHTM